MKTVLHNLKSVITTAVLCLILSGCDQPPLPSNGFAAQAALTPEKIKVGDIATLTLIARHPTESAVRFPEFGQGKEVVVRGRSVNTKPVTDSILETQEIYHITSYRPGSWLISTNPVVCTFVDGSERAQALPKLMLHVKSSLNEKNAEKLSDIKGPVRKVGRIFQIILLIILIAVAAGLITLFFMRKKEDKIEQKAPVPPHIKARKALEKLKEKEWIPEPFFVECSLILRTYLEDRFNLNAPDLTTEEMAAVLRNDPRLDLSTRETLQRFFTEADLVKFAQAGAEQAVMQTAFTTAEEFIDKTSPTEPETTDEIC